MRTAVSHEAGTGLPPTHGNGHGGILRTDLVTVGVEKRLLETPG